jgi:ribosomal protein S18 acetylase RimI-like enzyme
MGSPSFSIRAPRENDVEVLASLHVATWRETYAHLLPADYFSAAVLEQRRRQWTWIVQNVSAEWRAAVAETDAGLVVGFALAGPAAGADAPRPTALNMLYVLRSHHGTGIGQALLDEVLGTRPGFLWVAQDNARAQAFYRRNGFAADGAEVVDELTGAFVDVRMVR